MEPKTSSTPMASPFNMQRRPCSSHQQASRPRSHNTSSITTMLPQSYFPCAKDYRGRQTHHRPVLSKQIHPLPYHQNAGRHQNQKLHPKAGTVHFHRPFRCLPPYTYLSSLLKVPGFHTRPNALPLSSHALQPKFRTTHVYKGNNRSPQARAHPQDTGVCLHRRLAPVEHIPQPAAVKHPIHHRLALSARVHHKLGQVSAFPSRNHHILRSPVERVGPHSDSKLSQHQQSPTASNSNSVQTQHHQGTVSSSPGDAQLHRPICGSRQIPSKSDHSLGTQIQTQEKSMLCRLAMKVGARPVSTNLGDSLRPVQLGVSTRGGCKAAVHAARHYLLDATHRRVIFKVDMANAFNTIRQDVFLSAARERVPDLYELLWQAYSEPTSLFYGETGLVSATGIQQGDPFGPALFSLGIDRLTREVETEFNVWYLDDGTLGDSPDKVILCVRKLVEDLREVGLEVNQRKCELIILNHPREEANQTLDMFRDLFPQIKVIPASESFLLGASLSVEGTPGAVREKCEDLERLVSRLELIENHQAFALLKNCFSLPKLQHILRASPAYRCTEDLGRFDNTLAHALSTVTNVRFDENSLAQAVLPVRLGGLGIRMSKDIALPAYISSLHSVGALVDGIFNLNSLESNELLTAEGEWRMADLFLAKGADVCRQRSWSWPQAEAAAAELLEGVDQVSRARLMAAA